MSATVNAALGSGGALSKPVYNDFSGNQADKNAVVDFSKLKPKA